MLNLCESIAFDSCEEEEEVGGGSFHRAREKPLEQIVFKGEGLQREPRREKTNRDRSIITRFESSSPFLLPSCGRASMAN